MSDAAPPDWPTILAAIEDHLFPTLDLDVHERVIYYHLLRRTRLIGERSVLIAMSEGPAMRDTTFRQRIRSSADKGSIVIGERTRRGHVVEVLLPAEIESVALAMSDVPSARSEVDEADVFNDRSRIGDLLSRQDGTCFYCLRSVTRESAALDHVVPQVRGGDNTPRNIVVACVPCNSEKRDQSADDFLRLLYRRRVLSDTDLADRLLALTDLAAGKMPLST